MATSLQGSRIHRLRRRWRPAALTIGLLILISGGLIWLLSLLQILAESWSGILGASFTVCGVVLTLLQWLWPSPSAASSASSQNAQLKGRLQVKVREQLCGATVHADHGFHSSPPHTDLAANVIEQRNGNQVEFIAEFLEMDLGNYTISINSQEPVAHITIVPGRVTLIDWRYIRP